MPSAEFEKAAEEAQAFTKKPTNDELLKLYALFKQAKEGDVNTPEPGRFDFKAKYKWQAWNEQKGKSKEDAEKEYIEYVATLKEKYA